MRCRWRAARMLCSIVSQALEHSALGRVTLPRVDWRHGEREYDHGRRHGGRKGTHWLSKQTAEQQSNAQNIPADRPLEEGFVAVEIGQVSWRCLCRPCARRSWRHRHQDRRTRRGRRRSANGGPPTWHGAAFANPGRSILNRFSAAIDLKDDGGVACAALSGVEKADVVLQNMRPGLPIGKPGTPRTCGRTIRASSIATWRPLKSGGRWSTGLAMTRGWMQGVRRYHERHRRRRRPAGARVGPSLVDVGTGMWAVIGILSGRSKRPDRRRVRDRYVFVRNSAGPG